MNYFLLLFLSLSLTPLFAADEAVPTPYIVTAFSVLLLLLIYFFVRHRKEAIHAKEVEVENSTLSSDNVTLSSENREYRQSIEEHRELLEGMTNKLKDPTNDILGKTKKVLTTQLNDKQSIELRNIQDSGQVLFAIVDDLLDFMKIRSNKLEIEEKAFDINELLDLIVHSVVERIEKKDVEVIFDIDKSVPPRIIGDPIRIGQILTNLLENGIKFTHSGEVRLHVKRLGQEAEKLQLMFEVVDTGIGIPESKLDDIFTPFYQIKNNNNAGLGLSISKALVEMMGGEILVSTELNRGSTFTFVLGLQELDADEQRHYHLPDKAYSRRRVLIIDYHDSAAAAMKKLLEYFHNDVDMIPQADLDTMAPDLGRYDMLFISEKLLGFDLVKKVDALKAEKEIKLVVVGSMLHKSVNSNVVGKLADKRIMKPVNQQNIFDLLVDFYGQDETIVSPEIPGKTTLSMPRIVIERTQKKNVTKEDFKSFSGANILLAEDNIINQKVLSSLLKDSGIHIDMAEHGKTALEMVKDKEYDLILMDVNMPVMDGYEATERLKASTHTAHIPIVALSGNTMPEEIAEMKACGMDDRLEKPIKVHSIYSVFSKYLEFHPLLEEPVDTSLPDRLYLFEEGLERVGGDKALYKEIVNEFIKLYGDSDKMLEQYHVQKESAKLKALSLDIKGVSANIGVYALASAAKKINESSLSSTSMPKFLDTYKKTLYKTMEVLTTKVNSL
ncbi:ATP-binding protein [Sulfurimonas sp. HSL3-7]|uniref:ATP-binding protein n=1 Tax=Sulfonitrofixus jiaomeiensis TaxID=3131938 RepID=UPI0031F7B654